MIRIRCHHYPVQYLCDSWPFGELDLKLHPGVLIPRFETEHMINIVEEKLKSRFGSTSGRRFVEYGCGSGAVGLLLEKRLSMKGITKFLFKGIMIDINPKCVKLAKSNAIRNKC